MMPDSSTITIGAGIAGAFGVAWGFIQQFRSDKSAREAIEARDAHKLVAVKDELIKVIEQARDAWKGKYESEHSEFVDYRKEAHDRINEAQAIVLKYTEENASLRAKTDMSPVLEHQRQQTQINMQTLETLTRMTTALDLLVENIIHNKEANHLLELPRKTEE